MRISLMLALALSLVSAPMPAIAGLSPAETKMTQTVDAEQERTLAMLEKWVNQNSGSTCAKSDAPATSWRPTRAMAAARECF